MNPDVVEADSPAYRLFSPEGVHLDYPIAGPAPRMLAYLIDFVVIALLMLLLLIGVMMLLPIGRWLEHAVAPLAHHPQRPLDPVEAQRVLGQTAGLIIAIFVVLQFVVDTGYFIFWEMVTNGRSIGKGLLRLRVICRDGSPITLRASAIRNFMRIVDLLPANYLTGVIAMVVSAHGERLGDHAAGTLVIRLDRPAAAAALREVEILSPIPFERRQLEQIGPRELNLIRGVLRRMPELSYERAKTLAGDAAETIRARMELAELPAADPAVFLRQVLSAAEKYWHLPR